MHEALKSNNKPHGFVAIFIIVGKKPLRKQQTDASSLVDSEHQNYSNLFIPSYFIRLGPQYLKYKLE